MPIYEYACKSCQARFEKLQRSAGGNDATAPCPKCGSKQTERTLSVFAVGAPASAPAAATPGMCGRCGGPGPCGMD
jgi:putative FmdB family regulatory protein